MDPHNPLVQLSGWPLLLFYRGLYKWGYPRTSIGLFAAHTAIGCLNVLSVAWLEQMPLALTLGVLAFAGGIWFGIPWTIIWLNWKKVRASFAANPTRRQRRAMTAVVQ
jgi:hypothetical protein